MAGFAAVVIEICAFTVFTEMKDNHTLTCSAQTSKHTLIWVVKRRQWSKQILVIVV